MKKWVSVVLCTAILCGCCTACKPNEPTDQPATDSPDAVVTTTTAAEAETQTTVEKEGVVEFIVATNSEGVMGRSFIAFPQAGGITEGSGLLGRQDDGSIALVDTQNEYSPAHDADLSVDEIFPLYFDQTALVFEDYRSMACKDFSFEIVTKEKVVVNDYEMCKYTGKHTYSYLENTFSLSFVAYATKLKYNGACIYWMVVDDSEDQSQYATIESHAEFMAKSLYEEVI